MWKWTPIDLSEEDRTTLSTWANDMHKGQRLSKRAKVILLSTEKLSLVEISERVGMSTNFCTEWRKRFSTMGIEGLLEKPHSGRPKSLRIEISKEDRKTLSMWVNNAHKDQRLSTRAKVVLLSTEKISLKEISERVGMSTVNCSALLKRFSTMGIEGLLEKPHSGRPQSLRIEISEEDRKTLRMWVNNAHKDQRLSKRARVILLSNKKLSLTEISIRAGLSKNICIEWRKLFSTMGIGGLLDKPRSDRPKSLNTEITETDMTTLSMLATDEHKDQRLSKRAKVILLSNEKLSLVEISKQAGLCIAQCCKWRKRFSLMGIDGLFDITHVKGP